MFCYNCGKEIDDKAVVCVGCGVAVSGVAINGRKPSITPTVSDKNVGKADTILPLVSIFFMLLSLIFLRTFQIIYLDSAFYNYTWVRVEDEGLILGWFGSCIALLIGIIYFLYSYFKTKTFFRSITILLLNIALIVNMIIVSS